MAGILLLGTPQTDLDWDYINNSGQFKSPSNFNWGNTMKGMGKSLAAPAIQTIGEVANKGAHNAVGDTLGMLAGAAAAIPVYGWAASAALAAASAVANGLTNSVNREHERLVHSAINDIANTTSNATDYSSLMKDYGEIQSSNFDVGSLDDWGSTGWLVSDSNSARRKARDRALEALGIAGSTRIGNLNAQGDTINMNNTFLLLAHSSADGGSIYIKPSKRGTFTAAAKQRGMGVLEFASKVLASKEDYSPTMVKKANFARNAAKWHAFGGDLMTHGGDFSTGLTFVNNGGTHELNPNDGVLMGIAPDGMPNLVEEGEVKYNDYIFSNRLTIDKDIQEKYKLSSELTYAEAIKKLSKASEERPNDPISLNSLDAIIADLQESLEKVRARKQATKLKRQINKMSPDELNAMFAAMLLQSLQLYMLQIPLQPIMQESAMQLPVMAANGGNLHKFDWGGYKLEKDESGWSITKNGTSIAVGFDSPIEALKYAKVPLEGWQSLMGIDAYTGAASGVGPVVYNYTGPEFTITKKVPKTSSGIPFIGNIPITGNGIYNATTLNGLPYSSPDYMQLMGLPTLNDVYTRINTPTVPNFGVTTYPQVSLDFGRNNIYSPSSTDYLTGNNVSLFSTGVPNYMALTRSGNVGSSSTYVDPIIATAASSVTDLATRLGSKATTGSVGTRARSTTSVSPTETTAVSPTRRYSTNDFPTLDLSIPLSEDYLNTKELLKSNDDTTKDTTKAKKGLLTWMRYAPIVGSAFGAINSLFDTPDYGPADAALAASRKASTYTPIGYNPIGDYLTYNPFDINYVANLLRGSELANARALINNSANNAGALRASLLANAYNSLLGIGNAYRQGLESNIEQKAKVTGFNRETNLANLLMAERVAEANLRALMTANLAGALYAMLAAALRLAADLQLALKRTADLTGLFTSLGNLGRENFAFNQAASNPVFKYGYGDKSGIIEYLASKNPNMTRDLILGLFGADGGYINTNTKKKRSK